MKIQLVSLLCLALIGPYSLALAVTTTDGQKVEVSPEEIIRNIGPAARSLGKIIFDSTEVLPNGNVVFQNPRYAFNGQEYFIRWGTGSEKVVCTLLGLKSYANTMKLIMTLGVPTIYLNSNGSVFSSHTDSYKDQVIASLECRS